MLHPIKFNWGRYYTRAAAAATDLSQYFTRYYSSIAEAVADINAATLLTALAKSVDSLGARDAASIFNHADLNPTQAGILWDNSKLSIAHLILILDHPNITSAKIKGIFETGELSTVDRITPVLESDQFAAADAATSVNGTSYTVTQLANAFNHSTLTTTKLIAILDHANITSSKIKSIFETGLLSVDAKRASVLEGDQYSAADAATSVNGAYYTVSQLAVAFNDALLASTKVIAILDSANVSSAKIKSIFETGSLSVDEKRAAVLEGDQYLQWDAATSLNGSFYSLDEIALAFNNSILTHAKAAAILNQAQFAVSKKASLLDNANLTISRAGPITDHSNYESYYLRELFWSANLSYERLVLIAYEWGRLGGKTPTLSGTWTENPGNLPNATDNDSNTVTSEGWVSAQGEGATLNGYLNIDIGSSQLVKVLTLRYTGARAGYGSGYIKVQRSVNGSDWTDICNSLSEDNTFEINANVRYIRFHLYAYCTGGSYSKTTLTKIYYILC